MGAPIVFFDIAGPDDEALRSFYTTIFGWEFSGENRVSVEVGTPVQGAIRKDPVEKRLYIGVEDVAVTLARIEEQGGTINASRFEVPGVVVLGLFRDPAGNSMGLVEMENGEPKIP